MTLPVHHVPTLAGVAPGDVVQVTGDEAHHAVAVRRLRVGEHVLLTDGSGTTARAEVVGTGKRLFSARALEVGSVPTPEPRLVVVQALPKGDRGELAVEVLTEVGVATVVPWAAARSVAVWRGERAARSRGKWQATAREASKQARRAWSCEVAPLASTADVAALVGEADLALVLHEESDAPLARVPVPDSGTVLLVVGPEGGLTDDEVAAFVDAGARAVRLGSEVLRTSTAGVVAAAALLARTSRWS